MGKLILSQVPTKFINASTNGVRCKDTKGVIIKNDYSENIKMQVVIEHCLKTRRSFPDTRLKVSCHISRKFGMKCLLTSCIQDREEGQSLVTTITRYLKAADMIMYDLE